MLGRILYAVGCLLTIWGLGAGNGASFDARALPLSVAWGLLAVAGIIASKSKAGAPLNLSLAQIDLKKLSWAGPLSLAVALPFLLVFFLPIDELRQLVGFDATISYLKSLNALSMAAVVLVCVPAWAIVSRGFLVSWGVSGVALLDGITVGFSSQRLFLFLWVWLSSLMWGKIAQKKGFWVAFLTQVLSTIIVACVVRLK